MSDILDLVAPEPDERVHYGSAAQQFIDVRIPKSESRGALMMLHGGFWRTRYDLAHAGHFCAALTEEGYTTLNVEYRRVGDDGGAWPGTMDDLRAALNHIRQQHSEDVIVIGHSAGGQLALSLAAYETQIKGAISLAGVIDLRRADELHLSDNAVSDFLGGAPEQVPERYRDASPAELRIAVPQVVITGDSDTDVPPQISRDYVKQKTAQGESVELIEIPGADHLDVIDPRTPAFHVIRDAISRAAKS